MTPLRLTIAARWWADRIQQPASRDSGDPKHVINPNLPEWAAKALTNLYSPTLRLSAEQAEVFYAALLRLLVSELETRESEDWPRDLLLSVDYNMSSDSDPDPILQAACLESGTPLDIFPWKTTMVIMPTLVIVREGYNGVTQTLWEAK